MSSIATVPERVDVSRYDGKDTLIGLIRKEYRAAFTMLVEASDSEWHAQTPCELWEVRDIAGHLLDVATGYLGYFSQGEHGWPVEEPAGVRGYGEDLGKSALAHRDLYRWELLGRLDAVTTQLFRFFEELTPEEWSGRLVPHRYAGPLPAFMMAVFQLVDYTVHAWDLRKALGRGETVDEEAADVLVPYLFGVSQICFSPERAGGLDLTVGVHLTTPREEHWTVRIADGAFTFEPGRPETADVTLSLAVDQLALHVLQRSHEGTVTGDPATIERISSLFFTL
ncbi:MAG: maleylpyruvate isomerase family mycothiol-dependent enzyme [Acidimicrobiaceae bacterium]|nr:maleylpyruvate isomerase family mycothiol-dependent enzyme [Acidimicrobiaceae bacterium]